MAYSYETADPMLYSLLKEYAKKNRKNPTQAEAIMWHFLRGDFYGFSFRRQHIIGMFIADFICLDKQLIIEIDGGYHSLPEQQISDEERTEWLEQRGYRILRFSNEEVFMDTNNVLTKIKNCLYEQ